MTTRLSVNNLPLTSRSRRYLPPRGMTNTEGQQREALSRLTVCTIAMPRGIGIIRSSKDLQLLASTHILPSILDRAYASRYCDVSCGSLLHSELVTVPLIDVSGPVQRYPLILAAQSRYGILSNTGPLI